MVTYRIRCPARTGLILAMMWILCCIPPTMAQTGTSYCSRSGNMYLTANSGSLGTPGSQYRNNLTCNWYISVPVGKIVVFRIDRLDIEYEDDCLFDSLEVINPYGQSEQVYCGFLNIANSAPYFYTSATNRLHVRFTSDVSETEAGFIGHWKTENYEPALCRGTKSYTGLSGTFFTSQPLFTYANNAQCNWQITVDLNKIVVVRFLYQRFANLPGACNDYIYIYDGDSPFAQGFADCDSSTGLSEYRSTGNSVYISFRSSNSRRHRGFLATFYPELRGTPVIRYNDPGTYYCNTRRNVRTSASTGSLATGGSLYRNNMLCDWHITVPSNKIVLLKFDRIALEISRGCVSDYVSVRDGGLLDTFFIGFCGDWSFKLPLWVTTGTNRMHVRFQSNSFTTANGTFARWTSVDYEPALCNGRKTMSGSQGTFYSSQPGLYYVHNAYCTWQITVNIDEVVILRIHQLRLLVDQNSRCGDSVRLYDGSSIFSRRIASLCQEYAWDLEYRSTGNQMLVTFTTDSSGVSEGFIATFYAVSSFSGTSTLPNPRFYPTPTTTVATTRSTRSTTTTPSPTPTTTTTTTTRSVQLIPFTGECGLRYTSNSLGDIEAPRNSWPWLVSIQNSGRVHLCSGTIVDQSWILTAGHCVYNLSPSQIRVVSEIHSIGQWWLSSYKSISQIIYHPRYNDNSYRSGFDMALLLLTQPLTFNQRVAQVCLSPGYGVPGTPCYTLGWGRIGSSGSGSDRVLQTRTPIQEWSTCRAAVDSRIYIAAVSCAGGSTGSSCNADAGSPLVCQRVGSNQYDLWGFASWNIGCQSYTVYSTVTQVLSDIRNVINNRPRVVTPSPTTPTTTRTTTRTTRTTTPTPTTTSAIVRTPNSQCGRRYVVRISRGVTASPHSWPWQVSLQYRNRRHFCGGAIIAPRWILTAAHCVHNLEEAGIEVEVGVHNIQTHDGQRFYVREIVLHEGYFTGSFNHDIALLELTSSIQYGQNIGPVCLPQDNTQPSGRCYSTGWGDTTSGLGTSLPVQLQQVETPVQDHANCSREMGFRYQPAVMLCAGDSTSGTCGGDSGGPLSCSRAGRYEAVGIISFGAGTCTGFSGYTRVSYYRNWIRGKASI